MDRTEERSGGKPIRIGGWAGFAFWFIALAGAGVSAAVGAGVAAQFPPWPIMLEAEGLVMLLLVAASTLGARGQGFVIRLLGLIIFALVAAVVVLAADLGGLIAGAHYAGRPIPIVAP